MRYALLSPLTLSVSDRTILRYRVDSLLMTSLVLAFVSACGPGDPEAESTMPEAVPIGAESSAATEPNALRNAYFGDLHIHTQYSFDAFMIGTTATPDDAYRYAKGAALVHPLGFEVRLEDGPLDFYSVTDHAMFLGMLPAMADPTTEVSKLDMAEPFVTAETAAERLAAFQSFRPYLSGGRHVGVLDLDVVRSAWQEIVAAAERHNEPGKFTAFIGYEYTSSVESQNLHRNVIFRGSVAPDLPFSRLDSPNPEDLWAWMDGLRDEGIEALAIPHNSNGSNGQMFKLETFDGKPLDAAYAETRMRNEPLVEITQIKGTSDTHPLLSPNDEWAEFEIYPYRIGTTIASDPVDSYVRGALLHGIEMEEAQGFNPYRFGLIGSTDTHNGTTSVEESNYLSSVGIIDGTAQGRGSVPLDQPGADGQRYAHASCLGCNLFGASGLVGVWAEENTRDALYDAFRRKETFATTGPRMRVRFFAGYDFGGDLLADQNRIAKAYGEGVSMGADLPAQGERAPRFLALATRSPNSAALQRLQVIKGWVGDDGKAREQVFDVACSDGGEPDPDTHRCPENGAMVDTSDCSISEGLGAGELEALWSDPGFDAKQRAFYYVRVLENPTCRWSTWDAVRAGVEPNPDLDTTLQERAWSSPIWFVPRP